jgi:hypothetical protein
MPDLGPLAGALMELLRPALKALLGTAVGMAIFSIALAGGSFYLAAQGGSTGGAVLAGILALVVGAIFGGILSLKRAVLSALLSGLSRLALGSRVLGVVFSRIIGVAGVAGDGAAGDRGGAVARTVERLPLADAEARLRGAVSSLLAEGESGWLRRRLRERLLESVERVTLARFRAEGAGVDLLKVRDELAGQIDGLLAAQIGAVMTKLTVGLTLLTAVLSLGAALLIRRVSSGS